MSSGFELNHPQKADLPDTNETPQGFRHEIMRAFDERYLGQFIIEKLVTLDRSAIAVYKKLIKSDTSAE
ncbi:MAG TPA: hypothetical protein VFW52_02395 [Candidatus Saccharimonadales bacterium]|nr:hypothetical protein [Candidatus Saccharimonadales bacterium]